MSQLSLHQAYLVGRERSAHPVKLKIKYTENIFLKVLKLVIINQYIHCLYFFLTEYLAGEKDNHVKLKIKSIEKWFYPLKIYS